MKNKYKRIWACALPAVALGLVITMWCLPSLGQDTTAAGPQDTWAKYQIILQRNIFSRQRGPIRQSQRITRTRPVVVPNPESYFLLKGIVQEGGKFIAFLEDTQGNGVLKLREGDSVARGVLKNFTLDSIEYQLAEQVVSVALGQDLEGGQGAMTMSRLLELSATSSLTGDPNATMEAPTLSGDEAEILKKLMEQRKQQLGQ
ncbi:MAG TPA: hypothetical protein VMW24_16230 [Sedimentisphaerales bacterium]|nr:hypothetical protein [Sedimentisphaerales bacterium]